MTVQELINKLEYFDPNLQVGIYDDFLADRYASDCFKDTDPDGNLMIFISGGQLC